VLSVAVNVMLLVDAVTVPPVTSTLTCWLPLWLSVTVTVAGPNATPAGETLKVVGPGPFPVAGETVATCVLLLLALKAPV
jgi:hypothetical protein